VPETDQIEQALATVRRLAETTPAHLDKPLRLLGGGFWHGPSCTRYAGDLTSARLAIERALRDAEQLLVSLQHASAVTSP
jgi:hypothetical protein